MVVHGDTRCGFEPTILFRRLYFPVRRKTFAAIRSEVAGRKARGAQSRRGGCQRRKAAILGGLRKRPLAREFRSRASGNAGKNRAGSVPLPVAFHVRPSQRPSLSGLARGLYLSFRPLGRLAFADKPYFRELRLALSERGFQAGLIAEVTGRFAFLRQSHSVAWDRRRKLSVSQFCRPERDLTAIWVRDPGNKLPGYCMSVPAGIFSTRADGAFSKRMEPFRKGPKPDAPVAPPSAAARCPILCRCKIQTHHIAPPWKTALPEQASFQSKSCLISFGFRALNATRGPAPSGPRFPYDHPASKPFGESELDGHARFEIGPVEHVIGIEGAAAGFGQFSVGVDRTFQILVEYVLAQDPDLVLVPGIG